MRTRKILLVLVTLLVSASMMFGGTVTGKVTYTGTPVKMKPIDMSKEPSCAKQHATPVLNETVVAGANNSLDNVVVYISSGAPDDGQVPSQTVTYDQKGCQYIPHVLPMHVNQEFEIRNDDQTSHNIHPLPKVNIEWNKSQPPGTPPIKEKYDKPEFIPVKCNIHPWMHGWFVVLKTNHYDISKNGGSFTLPNLPAGKYTLTAWQEDYGTQTADVTITGTETKEVNFTFKAKAY
ncbi:MAG: carboxypeptidase regulatory-like domain-containing protein [Terriglobales bacterium]|jgi:carboxypeptidase family protein